MNQKINLRIGLLCLLILSAALSRLLPHPLNFTPIGALGLFGAAYFSNRVAAFAVPFIAMWISDLLLNNLVYARFFPGGQSSFHWFGSLWVYASFALITGLGMLLLRKLRPLTLLGASLGASTVFFLVTNFGVWLGSATYPQTPQGLFGCYAMGLPFFWNTVLGDLFFSAALFGVFELAQRRVPALRKTI